MKIRSKLESIGQDHLLQFWDSLNDDQKEELSHQVETLDTDLFHKQQSLLKEHPAQSEFVPYQEARESGNKEDLTRGKDLIEQGSLGCLMLAGGQGTRLGHDGPKGTFLLEGKSLFQLFAEKIAAINPSLPLAIMTSHGNDEQTRAFWKKHNFFGLKEVTFFTQNDLPLLNDEGNLFLETPSHFSVGPDGNGSVFTLFDAAGIWKQWEQKGIRAINVIPVDNVLAKPFDAELFGYHTRTNAEVTIKCTKRLNADERVGVLVRKNDRITVIEYSELGTQQSADYCANLGLFCVDMAFAKRISTKTLPLHLAHKATKYFADGETKQAKNPNAWKFERFIFDILPYVDRAEALLYPRDKCFAPLKNATGPDSPATVVEKLKIR